MRASNSITEYFMQLSKIFTIKIISQQENNLFSFNKAAQYLNIVAASSEHHSNIKILIFLF